MQSVEEFDRILAEKLEIIERAEKDFALDGRVSRKILEFVFNF